MSISTHEHGSRTSVDAEPRQGRGWAFATFTRRALSGRPDEAGRTVQVAAIFVSARVCVPARGVQAPAAMDAPAWRFPWGAKNRGGAGRPCVRVPRARQFAASKGAQRGLQAAERAAVAVRNVMSHGYPSSSTSGPAPNRSRVVPKFPKSERAGPP